MQRNYVPAMLQPIGPAPITDTWIMLDGNTLMAQELQNPKDGKRSHRNTGDVAADQEPMFSALNNRMSDYELLFTLMQ